MRIVIEIDEHRQPAPTPDVTVTRAAAAAPAMAAAGAPEELPPIDAGMAAPLAEGGGATPPDGAPTGMDESTGAMSAGAAPEDEGEG